MRSALRRWIGEPLDAELAEAFAHETGEVNRRRLKVLAPVMVCLHVAHVALFSVSAAARPSLAADVVRWRDGLVWAHGVMVPATLLLCWAAFRTRHERVARLLGPVMAILYLAHGAICTSLDQIVVANVSAYIGYCFGIAVVVALAPRAGLFVYAAGAALITGGMFLMQGSAGARLSSLPTCYSATVVGWVFSWMLHTARRREFSQRRTIERQREELSQLNAGLERRVADQVAEIVARAADVDRLNAQLQAQVVARSEELSLALARLAEHREGGHALARGTILGGRFVVAEVIGEGGMGAVYAGLDQTTGGRVAIKVIQATSTQQLDALRRFIREARATATITHPAVVRMLHIDVSDDGLLYQVQELIAGETLTRHLRAPWPAGDLARLASVLCEALAAAHAQGVVHRDVKPDNIMLTTSAPGLKLLDFGIAKLYDAVSRSDEATGAGMALGTPAYMSPEQVSGSAEVTGRADVYAVGVLLFRLATSRLPFEASSAHEMMMRHVLATPPDPRSFEPLLPEPVARAITGCLQRDPASRPSADAVAAELRAFADAAGAPALEAVARPDPFAAGSTVPTPRRRGGPA
ncbi:MAG TPA: serine/threonine-protein kinase [Kofleriaceae bacterium]|nr:serine/threonine-protein kinase [Kofleriaceae bacterium]